MDKYIFGPVLYFVVVYVLFLNSCSQDKKAAQGKSEVIQINFSPNFDKEFFPQQEIKKVVGLLMDENIGGLYNSSSDSLRKYFSGKAFNDYFLIVKELYGKLNYVKGYGYAGTAYYVGVDLKACFEKIDTVELRLGFHLDSVKNPILSHISYSPFTTSSTRAIDSLCGPIIQAISNIDMEALYRMASDEFQNGHPYLYFTEVTQAHLLEFGQANNYHCEYQNIVPITQDEVVLEVIYNFDQGDNGEKKLLLGFKVANDSLQLNSIDYSKLE